MGITDLFSKEKGNFIDNFMKLLDFIKNNEFNINSVSATQDFDELVGKLNKKQQD
jgi:hypothetical protein